MISVKQGFQSLAYVLTKKRYRVFEVCFFLREGETKQTSNEARRGEAKQTSHEARRGEAILKKMETNRSEPRLAGFEANRGKGAKLCLVSGSVPRTLHALRTFHAPPLKLKRSCLFKCSVRCFNQFC